LKDDSSSIFQNRFKIDDYSESKNLNAIGWCNELRLRKLLLEAVNSNSRSSPIIADSIERILDTPIEGGNEEVLLGEGGEAVTDLSIFDAFELGEFAKVIPRAKKRYDKFMRDDDATFEDIPGPLKSSYHSEALKVEGAIQFNAVVPIQVNLWATDEQIREELSAWLKRKREELELAGMPPPAYEKITTSDFSAWHRWKVLAYLDLVLFERFYKLKLPNHLKGQLLFPRERDVDMGERIRKVVKPLAERLISEQNISALTHLALIKQKEKRNKIKA
jgi:hypothetical protein